MRQDEVVSSDAAPPPPAELATDFTGAVLTASASPEAPATGVAPDRAMVQLDTDAVALARAAAVAEAGNAAHVGPLLVAIADDDIAVTATFTADQPGYGGWQWSVTLAVVGADAPTVSEVVLLPGEGALLAPAWVPWDQRIRPGDVGVGDLLPPIENDPRLVPAYLQSDDPAVEAVAHELGIGRVHVLSREGRVDFAERLHDGAFGPDDEMAVSAPAHCFSCAFFLPLAGSLGQLVGGCGNELSPADGRVVDAGYGCGAHSETVIEMPARSATTSTVIDEVTLEVHRRPRSQHSDEADSAAGATDLDAPAVDVDVDEAALELPEPIDLIDEAVLYGLPVDDVKTDDVNAGGAVVGDVLAADVLAKNEIAGDTPQDIVPGEALPLDMLGDGSGLQPVPPSDAGPSESMPDDTAPTGSSPDDVMSDDAQADEARADDTLLSDPRSDAGQDSAAREDVPSDHAPDGPEASADPSADHVPGEGTAADGASSAGDRATDQDG